MQIEEGVGLGGFNTLCHLRNSSDHVKANSNNIIVILLFIQNNC